MWLRKRALTLSARGEPVEPCERTKVPLMSFDRAQDERGLKCGMFTRIYGRKG